MGKKPKARGAPRKPKEQKIEDKKQSERFIQTARELCADENGEAFEQAASKIIASKRSVKDK
jgi:hypothetical protein